MPMPETDRLMREVRNLVGDAHESAPDGQLLARFADQRDERAFELLVRRYSRLVFGVCRRILVDPNAADDAFQATFLVLVHKAASLDRNRPVADWLYAVAFRLACRARANAARRRTLEAEGAQRRPTTTESQSQDDGHVIVHEELNRLPEQHRVPLVLSCLEGRTYEQVAQAIGCPLGSVGWRLTRAKEALRARLTNRGVVCPTVGIVALIASARVGTAVPIPLFDTTVRAGMWFAGRHAGDVVPSRQALELARGAIGTMTTSKWILTAAVLLAIGLCGGTAWLAQSAAMSDPPKAVPDQPAAAPKNTKPIDVPEGATARMGTAQFRHGDVVFFIAYTADGKGIVTAGRDDTLRLWDRATGQVVRQFERAEGKKMPLDPKITPAMVGVMMQAGLSGEFPLALSPDGRLLAAGKNRTITVWETATGKKLHELTTAASAFELAFTPDSKQLVSSDMNDTVVLWDPIEGKARKTFETKTETGGKTKTGSAISPAGTHLVQQWLDADTANGSLRIVDLVTGKAQPDVKLSVGGVQNITFSPDGKYLAWTSFTDGVTVWDVTAHKEVTRFGGGMAMKPRFFGKSLRISDDGKTVAVTLANDAIELWDIASGKLVQTIGGYKAPPSGRVAVRVVLGGVGRMVRTDLAFAPDGKTVAVSLDSATVRQFDTETGKEVAAAPGHLSGVMAVGTDGRTTVTVSRESVRVWDAVGGEVRHWTLAPPAHAVAISADVKHIAISSGKGAVQVWDTTKGEKIREIDTKRDDVAGIGFSPDGKLLATKAELNSAVNLWNATTGEHVRTIGQDGEPVFSGGRVMLDISGMQTPVIVFSPDGRLVAATGDKKQLRVWDVATGTELCYIPAPKTFGAAFAFSANGHVIALLTSDGVVTGYEVATGEKRFETKPAGAGATSISLRDITSGASALNTLGRGTANGGAIGFTADGRFVLSSAGHSALRVCDTLTDQDAGQLKGHKGSVSHLCLAADGKSLVTGSVDTTALTWDLSKLARVELTRDVPLSAPDLDQLWADLAKPDPAPAFAATRKLLTDRKQVATFLNDRLRPVPVVEDARIADLVSDLGGNFNARRKATAELERLGALAVPHLRKVLEGTPALDLKQRVEALLQKVAASKLSDDQLRELRSVELLELAATPEAKRVLETLAKGAKAARLTREADAALARLAVTK